MTSAPARVPQSQDRANHALPTAARMNVPTPITAVGTCAATRSETLCYLLAAPGGGARGRPDRGAFRPDPARVPRRRGGRRGGGPGPAAPSGPDRSRSGLGRPNRHARDVTTLSQLPALGCAPPSHRARRRFGAAGRGWARRRPSGRSYSSRVFRVMIKINRKYSRPLLVVNAYG